MGDAPMSWKKGGCHCGAVTFEVLAPDAIEAYECTCSICRMTGHLHYHIKKDQLRLLTGEDKITTYTFNTGTAKHHFCALCGVKSFYVPRSKPDGYSVNARCLKPGAVHIMQLAPFDGEHWEEAFARRTAGGKSL